ncbi:TrmH family RNA methyltransferase [Propionicicella superfundia]|uniref:TrmH family RNA methyltransferase n=1 Tax=Propionicicella superfundia TaxID=348582 RepID=UPI00040A69BA|nr:RNA methyltransferase [Propionicicella superfundia]
MNTQDPVGLAPVSKGRMQAIRKLLQRKGRRNEGKFLAEGPQAVREALLRGGVDELYIVTETAHHHRGLIEIAHEQGVAAFGGTEQDLASISSTVTPPGIVAVASFLDVPWSEVIAARPRLLVICDQVRDPGNAGTVIRCADAFGADAVVLTEDSVEAYNPKTVRATAGSLFHVPIVVGMSLSDVVTDCRAAGMQVLAADGDGDMLLPDMDAAVPTAWLFGNEAWGLPANHLEMADRSVAVPIFGEAESLNLATAAAVCLYVSATAQRA